MRELNPRLFHFRGRIPLTKKTSDDRHSQAIPSGLETALSGSRETAGGLTTEGEGGRREIAVIDNTTFFIATLILVVCQFASWNRSVRGVAMWIVKVFKFTDPDDYAHYGPFRSMSEINSWAQKNVPRDITVSWSCHKIRPVNTFNPIEWEE